MQEFRNQNLEGQPPLPEGEKVEVRAEGGSLEALKQKVQEVEQFLVEQSEKSGEENVRRLVEETLSKDNEGVTELKRIDLRENLLDRFGFVAEMWAAKMDEWMERVKNNPDDIAAKAALNQSVEYLKTK